MGKLVGAQQDPACPPRILIVTPGQPMFDAYTQRLAKDPGDVDATVRRAFVRLKMLAENEGFAKLLKMYGFEFFNDNMRFMGNVTDNPDVMETTEAIRTVCDECGPLSDAFPVAGIGALKVLDGVFADLDRVTSAWTGELEISPEDYPVDERVLFDYADIQALKACVLEASSVLNILKGYNMKLDKSMLRETFGALNRGPYPAGETGRNGTRRVLALNPEFMDRVLDPHALALAQAQMQRAAIAAREFDLWRKKRTNTDVHFLEVDVAVHRGIEAVGECFGVAQDHVRHHTAEESEKLAKGAPSVLSGQDLQHTRRTPLLPVLDRMPGQQKNVALRLLGGIRGMDLVSAARPAPIAHLQVKELQIHPLKAARGLPKAVFRIPVTHEDDEERTAPAGSDLALDVLEVRAVETSVTGRRI